MNVCWIQLVHSSIIQKLSFFKGSLSICASHAMNLTMVGKGNAEIKSKFKHLRKRTQSVVLVWLNEQVWELLNVKPMEQMQLNLNVVIAVQQPCGSASVQLTFVSHVTSKQATLKLPNVKEKINVLSVLIILRMVLNMLQGAGFADTMLLMKKIKIKYLMVDQRTSQRLIKDLGELASKGIDDYYFLNL